MPGRPFVESQSRTAMQNSHLMEHRKPSGIGSPALGPAMLKTPDLRFDVTRSGSRIGRHEVRCRQDDGALLVNVDVDVVVGLGPMVMFRFTHRVTERWEDGRFVSLESRTTDNGKHYQVSASRTEGHVIVESSATGRSVLSPDAIPLTHWNSLCLERALFSSQDGASIAARFNGHFEETVTLAEGRKMRATRYSLAVKPVLYNWYDSDRVWTSLRTEGRDGSTIQYRRVG
jgi:hypothetical protein